MYRKGKSYRVRGVTGHDPIVIGRALVRYVETETTKPKREVDQVALQAARAVLATMWPGVAKRLAPSIAD